MSKRKPSQAEMAAASVARTRRFIAIWFGVSLVAAAVAGVATWWERAHPLPVDRYVKVYRQHGCTCAIAWARKLESEGFIVALYETHDLHAIRRYLRTPAEYRGCHVAEINHYFIEGHVPGDVLKRLMSDHPKGMGVAVVSHTPKEGEPAQAPEKIVLLDMQGEQHPVAGDPNEDTLQF